MQSAYFDRPVGMGENLLILAFVLIVIGGSARPRRVSGRELRRMIDTLGRASCRLCGRSDFRAAASDSRASLSHAHLSLNGGSVLVVRPEGLFPANLR